MIAIRLISTSFRLAAALVKLGVGRYWTPCGATVQLEQLI